MVAQGWCLFPTYMSPSSAVLRSSDVPLSHPMLSSNTIACASQCPLLPSVLPTFSVLPFGVQPPYLGISISAISSFPLLGEQGTCVIFHLPRLVGKGLLFLLSLGTVSKMEVELSHKASFVATSGIASASLLVSKISSRCPNGGSSRECCYCCSVGTETSFHSPSFHPFHHRLLVDLENNSFSLNWQRGEMFSAVSSWYLSHVLFEEYSTKKMSVDVQIVS